MTAIKPLKDTFFEGDDVPTRSEAHGGVTEEHYTYRQDIDSDPVPEGWGNDGLR